MSKIDNIRIYIIANSCLLNNIIKLLFLCCQCYSFRTILIVSNWQKRINVKGRSETLHRQEYLVAGTIVINRVKIEILIANIPNGDRLPDPLPHKK